MSHPHRRESLLTQLESMHKQLNDETQRKWSHNSANGGNGDHRGARAAGSGMLSRNERNSMPMFAGSSSHSGLLASNNSQDMDFVMGLSENLLVECRRLQAENESKKRKLESVKQDHEELKEKHQKLNNTHQVVVKELQSLRDTNWDLENKLQSVSVESRSLREKLSKNKRDLKVETECARQFKTDLEVSELKLANLEKQLESTKNQHMAQIAELRKHVCELNDENDALHLKNRESQEKLQESKDREHSTCEALRSAQRDLKSANDVIVQLRAQIKTADAMRQPKNSSTENQQEGPDERILDNNLGSDVSERQSKEQNVLPDIKRPVEFQDQMVTKSSNSEQDRLCAVSGNYTDQDSNQERVSDGSSSEQAKKIDHMATLLKDYGYMVIGLTEYNDMMNNLKEYKNSKSEYLRLNATHSVKELISPEPKKISNPSIPENESTEQSPSLDYLSAKAREIGYGLLKLEELDEMKRKLSYISCQEQCDFASDKRWMLVAEEEYYQTRNRLENPSIRELQAKTLQLGYIMLSVTDYDAMQREKISPSEEYLAQKALYYDKLLVEKTSYEALLRQTDDPSEDFLAEHAALLGKVLVSESDYNEGLGRLAAPSHEFLMEKAAGIGFSLVSFEQMEMFKALGKFQKLLEKSGFELTTTAEHELLLNYTEIPTGQKGEVESGCLLAAEDTAAGQKIDIMKMLRSGSFVLLGKDSYQSLLDACIKRVTKREVFDICSKFDMIAIPSEEYGELIKEPTLDEIRSMAARHASVVVMREQFDMLKAQVEYPPDETIERCADRKGMVLVKRSDHESLMLRFNNPTKLEIEKQAEKLGMIAIASERYEHLLKELKNNSPSATPSPSSKVQASRQYFEQVIRNQNKQSDKLYGPTKTLGFVTLSNEEYKKLKENQKSYTLTKADIYKGAREFSLAVLPLEEYKALLRRKLVKAHYEHDSPDESTTKFDMKVVTFQMDSPTPSARKSAGANLLRFRDHPSVAQLDDYASCSQIRSDDDLDSHMQHDHSDQEVAFASPVVSTVSPHIQSPDRTSEDLKEGTGSDAMLVSPQDPKYTDQTQSVKKERRLEQEQQEVPGLADASNTHEDSDPDDSTDLDEDTLIREAKKKDLVLITRIDYEKFLAAVKSTTTKETLETEAAKLNLVVLEKKEYKELIDKHEVEVCYIEKLAHQFGLRVVSEDYLRQLETTDNLTVDNVKERIANLGYVALKASEFDALNEKAMAQRPKGTQESISSNSSSSNLGIEPKLIKKEAKDESSNDEVKGLHMKDTIESRLWSTPVASKNGKENEFNSGNDIEIDGKEMPCDLSADDILRWASRFKLVPIELEHFEQIKEELRNPKLTLEEIVEQAEQHNLVAIPADVYEQLQESSKDDEQDTKTVEMKNANDNCKKDMTFDAAIAHLKEIADRFNLFRSPKEASGEYKLYDCSCVVVLSDVYYDELLNNQRKLACKVAEESTQSKNRMLASKASPKKPKTHKLPQPTHNGGLDMHKQISTSSPKSPARNAAASTQKAQIKFPKSLSHSTAFMPKHSRGSSVARNDSTASPSIERSNSMGALSLATIVSLSEPSIIPALTQTVIGEYLYKYYPYFGPFGLNSRHERFFWVHPYTLTLYWSRTNPVLSNPANHKTKCAAIISVESVVDTNPYPAGLYHKSIIITTDDKTVKITCATRQRHNIWYNSLRYLVQRSMEGISLEAIADDPSDNMYSGKIFPLPGENSKSASRRLSSSRRSVRARISKTTSMPIKKND